MGLHKYKKANKRVRPPRPVSRKCGKVVYGSERQALESLIGYGTRPFWTYRCKTCGLWHLTSKEPWSYQ
jgi:uncharacterized membrane protein